MGGYPLLTVKGYDFGEVASALQKALRRGEEEAALFWAVELDESGYAEYLWKRLRIICSEDVGPAEPHLPATLRALYESWRELKAKADDKHRPERLFIVHAIILLARARKSRLVDWALIVAYGEHGGRTPEIPDVALDKHTGRGQRLGRGWGHFFSEGTQLANHDAQPGEEEYRGRARAVVEPPAR